MTQSPSFLRKMCYREFKRNFLHRLYGGHVFYSCFTLYAVFQKCSQCVDRGQPRSVPYFTCISLRSTRKRDFRLSPRSSRELVYYAANIGNLLLTFRDKLSGSTLRVRESQTFTARCAITQKSAVPKHH